MSKKKIIAVFLVLAMLTSMLGACTKKESSTDGAADNSVGTKQEDTATPAPTGEAASGNAKTGVIKIGTIQDISGPGSVLGNASVQGHAIAIEDINNAGGIVVGDTTYTLELVAYDCKSDPNEGINVFKRLAEVDKVPIILGPSLSNVALATVPYTEEYGISYLGQFGDPRCMLGENLDTLNPYMFLMQPSATQSAIIAGAYMIDKLNLKKVGFLIAQDHSFCSAQANAFIDYCKEQGIEITGTEYNKQADMDMKTQLTKLKNSGCDFIFNANPTQPLVVSSSQKYQLGIDIPQTGSLDFSSPFATLVSDPAMSSDIYFASNVDYGDSEYVELNEKCQASFGQDATVKTALGYDQVLIAVAAIQKAGSLDPKAIRDALENIQGVDTVITDDFNMDPSTHMPKGLEMCMYNIEDGQYKMVEWYVPDYLK